jgi:hypothetical protein
MSGVSRHLYNAIYNVDVRDFDILEVSKPKSRTDIYTILHELGHLQDKTIRKYNDNKMKHELIAWQYVYRCVKPVYHDEVTTLSVRCLMSYSHGKLTRKQIKTKLLKGVK